MIEERLHKVLARAGVASLREAEGLIAEGRVTVAGDTVTRPGTKVDSSVQEIRVDGEVVKCPKKRTYLLLNKPRGYICALKDPKSRPLITDLIRGYDQRRLFPVGRLDYDTEGLLILTNDGAFAHTLTHPSRRVKKVYLVKVKGIPSHDAIKRMESGLFLDDGKTAPCTINFHKKTAKGNTWFKAIFHEGKNRQIKRMFALINNPVLKIRRVGISFLNLGGLKIGEYRSLTPEEVRRLEELHG